MKIELYKVTLSRPVVFSPVKGRIVKLEYDTCVRLFTNEGIYVFYFKEGFIWNGRSGGPLVDPIAANQGTQMESAMWLFHDGSGYPDTISTPVSGELLRQFAMIVNNYSGFRAGGIKGVVNLVSGFWKAYDWEEVKAPWDVNRGKVRFCLEAR